MPNVLVPSFSSSLLKRIYTLLDDPPLNLCNNVDASGTFLATLFKTLPLLPDLYRRILPNNERRKLKSNIVFLFIRSLRWPFRAPRWHPRSMQIGGHVLHRYHPKAGIGFTILHFPSYLIVVSKDAFHCVYLAVVRAYLLKSACSNSVKFWRTKSRICLSVNFLPNSISFTLPSRFSWSQGFPRGIALGSSLNHTKVRDDFGPVTALAGEGDRDLSLAELDSAIVIK